MSSPERQTDTSSRARNTLALLWQAPSLRVMVGLVTFVVVAALVKEGLLKPLFTHFFDDDPTATTIRRILQLLLFVGIIYLVIRVMKLYERRMLHAAFTRILVATAVILLLPTVVLDFVLTPLLSLVTSKRVVTEMAPATLMIFGVMIVYARFFKVYEKREIHELSPRPFLRETAIGFAVGIIIPSLTFLGLYVTRYYTVSAVNPVSVLAFALVSLAFYSCLEELFFRGVVYRICEENLGTHLAVIISAGIFGAAHLANENVNLTGFVSATLGGALLGVLFSLTGRLWIPIAFHLAWNFTQVFFGSAVSGTDEFGSFLQGRLDGPEWLTGGAFGVENSVPLLMCLVMLIVYVYYRVYRRGRVIQPYWGTRPSA